MMFEVRQKSGHDLKQVLGVMIRQKSYHDLMVNVQLYHVRTRKSGTIFRFWKIMAQFSQDMNSI